MNFLAYPFGKHAEQKTVPSRSRSQLHPEKIFRLILRAGTFLGTGFLLWGDPLELTTLQVQAQVEIMEDGTLFDPVWYRSEYPQGAGPMKLAQKKTAQTQPEEDVAVESYLTDDMTTEEIYREYQLYGQGQDQKAYDALVQNGTMLEEIKKAAAMQKRRHEAQAGVSWNVITAQIYDTDEVKIWDTEYLISDQDARKLSDIVHEFENDGYEIGFVLVDIRTGDAISYHAGAEIYSASVIKAPYIFSLLENGIAPTRDMYLAGNQSDNDAYQRIRRAYGNQIFENWIAGTGVPKKQSRTRYIMTTPLDLCRMFYKGTALLLGDEEYSDWARDTFTDSLNSAVALTVGDGDYQYTKKVYSKAGWIASDSSSMENSYTNGAIVDGEYPYVVTVMSNSPGYIGIEYAKNLMPILDEIHDEMVDPDKALNPDAKAADVTDFANQAQSAARHG